MPIKPLTHAQRQGNRRTSQQCYDNTQRNTEATRIRRSMQWRKVSKRYRRLHPLCEDPYGTHKRMGETVIADHVHHKKPLAIAPKLAYTLSNLQSLCACCHARAEAEIRKG